MNHISGLDGQAINVTKWFNLYSFDVMGDLAFGKPFDMLEAGGEHWAIKLLNAGLEPLAFAFPVWFFRVLTAVPGLTKDWWRFIDFCAKSMEQRMKVLMPPSAFNIALTKARRRWKFQISRPRCWRPSKASDPVAAISCSYAGMHSS